MSPLLLLLLLLLLGFSFHACGAARSLGVLVDHKEIDESLKMEIRVSTPPLPNNDDTRDEGGDPTVQIDSDDRDLDQERRVSESGSVASVKWRVPHRKKGEPEPRFDQDYLPPKTHPPSHN